MAKIQEQRQKLEAKLKEMAEDGVMKTPQKDTLAFDPPDEENEEDVKIEVSSGQKEKQYPVKEVMPALEDKQDKTLYKSHERGNGKSAETSRISLDDLFAIRPPPGANQLHHECGYASGTEKRLAGLGRAGVNGILHRQHPA